MLKVTLNTRKQDQKSFIECADHCASVFYACPVSCAKSERSNP